MEKPKTATQNAAKRSDDIRLSDDNVEVVTTINLGSSVELKATGPQGKIIKKEIIFGDERKN